MSVTRDEHGDVLLDPAYPADVQTSEENLDRWQTCVNLAVLVTRQPAGSSEVTAMARSLYNSPTPTHRAAVPDGMTLQEAQFGFDEFEHPRGRGGEWIGKGGRRAARKKIKGLGRDPGTPQISADEIERLGLNDWPEPTELALRLLKGARETRFTHASDVRTEDDHPSHSPYTKERRLTHDKIVGEALAEPISGLLGEDHVITKKLKDGGRLSPEERVTVAKAAHNARGGESPDVLFMAGGPASGKSTVLEENPELKPEDSVHVDPDKIKESLPEYQQLRSAGDPYAASAVHYESGDIAARVTHEATRMGLNSVIDGTGNSEPEDFLRQLQAKHDAGYDVSVLYANTPTDVAIGRAIKRAEEEGRFVPIPRVREQHAKVSRNFAHVAKLPFLEHLDVYDDSGHVGMRDEMTGEFNDLDEGAMDAFRAKADEPHG